MTAGKELCDPANDPLCTSNCQGCTNGYTPVNGKCPYCGDMIVSNSESCELNEDSSCLSTC